MLERQKKNVKIDLSHMNVEELRDLIAKAEQVLAMRRFEEGLSQAIREYQTRDPRIIRV